MLFEQNTGFFNSYTFVCTLVRKSHNNCYLVNYLQDVSLYISTNSVCNLMCTHFKIFGEKIHIRQSMLNRT